MARRTVVDYDYTELEGEARDLDCSGALECGDWGTSQNGEFCEATTIEIQPTL